MNSLMTGNINLAQGEDNPDHVIDEIFKSCGLPQTCAHIGKICDYDTYSQNSFEHHLHYPFLMANSLATEPNADFLRATQEWPPLCLHGLLDVPVQTLRVFAEPISLRKADGTRTLALDIVDTVRPWLIALTESQSMLYWFQRRVSEYRRWEETGVSTKWLFTPELRGSELESDFLAFDVLLSYKKAYRATASEVATLLQDRGYRVYLDAPESSQLSGATIIDATYGVYGYMGRIVVALTSTGYWTSDNTMAEWTAARERNRNILAVTMDQSPPEQAPSTIAINFLECGVSGVVDATVRRIGPPRPNLRSLAAAWALVKRRLKNEDGVKSYGQSTLERKAREWGPLIRKALENEARNAFGPPSTRLGIPIWQIAFAWSHEGRFPYWTVLKWQTTERHAVSSKPTIDNTYTTLPLYLVDDDLPQLAVFHSDRPKEGFELDTSSREDIDRVSREFLAKKHAFPLTFDGVEQATDYVFATTAERSLFRSVQDAGQITTDKRLCVDYSSWLQEFFDAVATAQNALSEFSAVKTTVAAWWRRRHKTPSREHTDQRGTQSLDATTEG